MYICMSRIYVKIYNFIIVLKFLNEFEVLIIGIDYIICGEIDIKFLLLFF